MPAKVSAVWFPPNERLMSTMVGVNTSILGSLIGLYLPSLVVTEVPPRPGDHMNRFEIANLKR
jgi:hypothetical protein